MKLHLIRRFRYRLFALVMFFCLFSALKLNHLLLGEESFFELSESIQIKIQWPGKTALQVEEEITKPWEQILKGVSGYKQIESISERGNAHIHLELEKNVKQEDIVFAIRNEYLLQRQRFPKDSLSPKIQTGKPEDQFIVILQKVQKSSDQSRQELEKKIRTIAGVSSFQHHSDFEKEIVLEIMPTRIQGFEFPSLSVVFAAIRNHNFGYFFDPSNGLWFQKDFPTNPKDWSKLGIPSRFGEGLLVSSIGDVKTKEKKSSHGTRINGLHSETILVHAKNGSSLYQITKELNSILENHKDWVLLYTSHQDFFDDLYRFFILFLFLDLIFFFVPFFYPVEWEFIFVSLLSFYIVLVIFLGICCLLLFPIGRSILFLFLVWKYFLVLFPIRRMGKWFFSFFISFSLLWFFIILNWVPKIFGLLFLVHLYFLLLVPFTRNLLQSFSKKGNPSLKFSFREIYHSHKEMFTREIKSSKKINLILPLFLLMMGVLVSFFSSFGLQTVVAPYGSIQMGRLEFPTFLPEQESIRITKQVESVILMRKITDFLVVKQNPSNAIFYFRLNELGRKIGFQNLPIEPGYFHLLGESDVNSDRKIRFSNANTEILEKTILWLTPWIRTKKEVEEVVLCFQPSAEGLDLQTSAYYRNMLGLDWDDSLRERSIELQSSIVGKMILDKKLIDIRFVAKQEKKLERYPTKPTKMNLGIPVFTSSLSNYETVKTPARIYRKNGETSLEILVKGKSIHWEELESEMKQFLAKEKVQFTVIAPLKESLPKYRPIFFLLAFSLFLYRKKNKPFWLVSICVLFLLWKIDVSVLGADYFLFGSVASFIFFLLTWFPQTSFHWKLFIPFFLLLTLSYILPGEGGRFFMGGFLLISIFFLLYFKIWQKWRIMKTKLIF